MVGVRRRLGDITDNTSYASSSNSAIRTYLGERTAASKVVVTIKTLEKLVKKHLRVEMFDMDDRSKIKILLFFAKN